MTTRTHAARSADVTVPRAVTSAPSSPWCLMHRKRSAARSRPSPIHRRRMSPSRQRFDVSRDVPERADQILDTVRRREEAAERRRQPQLQYRERFLEAFAHTGGGIGLAVSRQPRRERRQLPARRGRAGRSIGPPQGRPDVRLAGFRHEGVEVAPLVPVAALNDCGVAEDIAERFAQPLAAVDHPQHAAVERESAREADPAAAPCTPQRSPSSPGASPAGPCRRRA